MQLVPFSNVLSTHDILSDSQKDIGSKSLKPPSSNSLIRTENLIFAGLIFHKNFKIIFSGLGKMYCLGLEAR